MSAHEYYSTCFYIQLALNFSIFFFIVHVYDDTIILYRLGDKNLGYI
jgi:hypothetical protein